MCNFWFLHFCRIWRWRRLIRYYSGILNFCSALHLSMQAVLFFSPWTDASPIFGSVWNPWSLCPWLFKNWKCKLMKWKVETIMYSWICILLYKYCVWKTIGLKFWLLLLFKSNFGMKHLMLAFICSFYLNFVPLNIISNFLSCFIVVLFLYKNFNVDVAIKLSFESDMINKPTIHDN